jgi:hypothetical protein
MNEPRRAMISVRPPEINEHDGGHGDDVVGPAEAGAVEPKVSPPIPDIASVSSRSAT